MLLVSLDIVLVQAGTGMAVNLYVSLSRRHPGSHPRDYFVGSLRSMRWALGHGAVALVVHASLGLALAVLALVGPIYAALRRRAAVALVAGVAGLLVIGAGFNGASYLDYNDTLSSLLMALLGFGAVGLYSVALLLQP